MSLIYCPECNKEISDKASLCPQCGFPIHNYIKESEDEIPRSESKGKRQVSCQFCMKPNDEGSMYCGYCGQLIDVVEIQRRIQLDNFKLQTEQREIQQKQLREQQKMQREQLEIQQKQLREQQKIQRQQENEYKNIAKCPKCGSTSLSGNKKGFGVGKAVVGVAIAGPLGLIAGNVHAKKIKVTCLKCGKQFWA